ncbi:metallothionein-I transcription activator [Pyrenophora tritici-repentis]|nr:metallothionein-Itranscription activator [Pyrenophora tritici-repentis]KAI0620090.1 metallothionein-Itranscription activator [Pyrenophora tritici-repentis]KAI2487786.1 metallothionein-I transcription activator [Pyrenophora tritici-repentis]
MSGYNPAQATTSNTDPATLATIDSNARAVLYKCGDCDMDVPLKRGEPIRCRNCGHRVLYKQRTNREKELMVEITVWFNSKPGERSQATVSTTRTGQRGRG